MAKENHGGRGQPKRAKQVDQMVRTNFEFAQGLGAEGYAPPGSASEPKSPNNQQTPGNPARYGG